MGSARWPLTCGASSSVLRSFLLSSNSPAHLGPLAASCDQTRYLRCGEAAGRYPGGGPPESAPETLFWRGTAAVAPWVEERSPPISGGTARPFPIFSLPRCRVVPKKEQRGTDYGALSWFRGGSDSGSFHRTSSTPSPPSGGTTLIFRAR